MRRFREAPPAAAIQPPKGKRHTEPMRTLMKRKQAAQLFGPAPSSKVLQRIQAVSTGPALIDEEYVPQTPTRAKNITLLTLKPCRPAIRSKQAGAKRFRECQVELAFLDKRAADAVSKHNGGVKVAPGPYMRVCLRPEQPGRLIPVRDPIEAKKFSEDWCRCTKREGDGEKCLRVNQTLERAPFGRSRRKATRRR